MMALQTNSEMLIQVNQLHWQVDERAILTDIQFDVPSGAMAGIIGPNGAGKTSLLRCLTGFHQPDLGTIQYKNQPLQDWSGKALAQQMALVSQHHDMPLQLTVFELVRMGLIPYKLPFSGDTQEDLSLISECLDHVGLLDSAHQSVATLSGGERQRAMIAKALVQQPQLLLLDEPTNHLDMCYQHDILQLVRALPMTVLASLHDVNLAAHYCDWLILIKQGKTLACGPTEVVFTPTLLSELFDTDCRIDRHPYHPGLWMNFSSRFQP